MSTDIIYDDRILDPTMTSLQDSGHKKTDMTKLLDGLHLTDYLSEYNTTRLVESGSFITSTDVIYTEIDDDFENRHRCMSADSCSDSLIPVDEDELDSPDSLSDSGYSEPADEPRNCCSWPQYRNLKVTSIIYTKCSSYIVEHYFVRRHRGDVIRPTLVMERYRRQLNTPSDDEVLGNSELGVTSNGGHDTRDSCTKIFPLMITDPSETLLINRRLYIGATVVTLSDAEEDERHFIQSVISGSAAAQMFFEENDELLLLNDKVLVGLDSAEVMMLFQNIHVDEEFWMYIRRPKQSGDDIDGNCVTRHNSVGTNGDLIQKYTYWKVKATISVKHSHGISHAYTTTAERYLNDSDIIVIGKPVEKSVFVNAKTSISDKEQDGRFFFNNNGQLAIGPETGQVPNRNPEYTFQSILYKVFTDDSTELSLFGQSLDGETGLSPAYLYISRDEQVTLEAAPENLSRVPTKAEIEDRRCLTPDFCIHRALFHRRRVPTDSDVETISYFLEPFGKPGFYVCFDIDTNSLILKNVTSMTPEQLKDLVQLHFGIHDAS